MMTKQYQERREIILELRKEGKTLQNIGDSFGLSRERIRQIIQNPAKVRPIKIFIGLCQHCGIKINQGFTCSSCLVRQQRLMAKARNFYREDAGNGRMEKLILKCSICQKDTERSRFIRNVRCFDCRADYMSKKAKEYSLSTKKLTVNK